MATWTNRRPPTSDAGPMQIVRVPPTAPVSGLISSTDLIGCHTHFYRNRTIPCEGNRCPACNDGYTARWHAWVGLYLRRRAQHVLFEVTAAGSEHLARYADHYGSLRGADLKATRPNGKPNGRVQIVLMPGDLNGIQLPDPPDVLAALSKIWNIPLPDLNPGPNRGNGRLIYPQNRDDLRTADPTLRTQTRQNHA